MANKKSHPLIVVIGSGISGLSAAGKLTQCLPDCKVIVLEALSRPGGRVNSIKITENEFLEEGATWIHGVQDNPIKALVKQQTFTDDEYYSNTKYCKNNGEEVSAETFNLCKGIYYKLLENAKKFYKNPNGNRMQSLGEFLQQEFLREVEDEAILINCERTASSVFHHMSQIECCISGCNSLFDLVLDDFGEYVELAGGDFRIPGGYNKVIEKLLANLHENSVVYNSPVTEVKWMNDHIHELSKPVRVTCKNGEEYYADHVIATQSLGYLKENARTMFKPALPQAKLNVIDRMGFNYVTKIRLRYASPFWKDTITCISLLWDRLVENAVAKPSEFVKENWHRKIFEFMVNPSMSNTLEVWLSGEAALHAETLQDNVISERCTGLLREFLQDPSIPEPIEILKTAWNTNPYTRGAYSYIAVGSSGADCDILVEPLCVENCEGVNIPRVLFAGEATHRTFYSTTHGALLSGEREAQRLIDFYQAHK